MKLTQKQLILTVGIITLIIAGGLVGLVLYYNGQSATNTVPTNTTNIYVALNNNTNATQADTSNWDTYTNSELGLSLKYPTDWNYEYYKDYSESAKANLIFGVSKTLYPNEESRGDFGKYSIKSFPSDNLPLGEWIEKNETWLNDDSGAFEIQKEMMVKLAEKDAKYIKILNHVAGGFAEHYYLAINDRILEIQMQSRIKTGYGDDQQYVDGIFAAIKDSISFSGTDDGSKNSVLFNHKYLWLAQKDGALVSVKRVDLSSGHEGLVFTYSEKNDATLSGNLWEGLPPNIALSHDGQKLAYASKEGLSIHDIATSDVQTLISKTSEAPTNTEGAPTWSSDELRGVYTIAYPRWSADDENISFSNGYYEGSKVKIFDISNNKVISLAPEGMKSFGTTYRISWADSKVQYVIANSGGYSIPGLFIGTSNSLSAPVNYSQYVNPDAVYEYADSSKDGTMIATAYKDSFESSEKKVAVLDVPKETSVSIPNISWPKPFFGSDNTYLYYIDDSSGEKLTQYNLSSGTVTKTLDLSADYTRWEKVGLTLDGYIELWGSVAENNMTVASNTNQLFVVDPSNLRIVYQSEIYSGFTSFLGFTD